VDSVARDILIVDDDRQVREVLHQIFLSAGYACRLAEDGRAGVTAFTELRPELVVTDLKMPLMSGIELLQQIRAAVTHLRSRGTDDLARVTLMSDGVSVYECTSSDEVVDLLQGGQGVFGIALGRIWQEVDGTLADLPAEQADEVADGTAEAAGGSRADELARRRARRTG